MGEVVVVGYDGKEPAKRALERAIETVKAAGGRIVVVTVAYEPVEVAGYMPDRGDYEVRRTRTLDPASLAEAPPALRPILDEATARVGAAGLPADYVWGVGDPARTIVDAARDHHASKIMIGPDHHSWLGRLFGDDVEAEVKREAGCEIVVV